VPLTDVVTVAELLAVSAALAALRVVRVYAAPLVLQNAYRVPGQEQQPGADPVTQVLLAEADWPEPVNGQPAAVTSGGAAMLAALAEPGVPPLRLAAVGYGIGPDAPQILRCTVGELFPAPEVPKRGTTAAHAHGSNDGDHS
jgi:hypothetical protein